MLTTRTFAAPSRCAFSSSSRARPRWSSTAVTSPWSIVAFAPGAAQASRIRSPSREPSASAASCEPRLCQITRPAGSSRSPALEAVGTRHVGRLPDRDGGADDELRRLVLRAHQRERLVGPEVAHPDGVDPVGVGLGERARRERGDEAREALGEPAGDGVREAGGAGEAGLADELDGVVDDRVRRGLAPGELVARDPERCEHRRVELGCRAASERLDAVVDRPLPLDGAVGDPLGERPVALVEAGGGARDRPVGVGAVLEHAPDDPVGGRPGRRRHRIPRRNSS